ncbi:MAG: response regulator transcription factor [Phenylobacterium sp.]|uniref:response regulator transcription factor n=1 Tax=Phenylobacterium sp. TaxID=1871053 RepID=UPI002722C3B6|nr:response regulator transcription factor [Phenylobacterium sp.]MDO8901876.1 response regulator transcription factor [Phenylobacterium sp.]MDP2212605.1 response regulator transcription factor [Phenylobacterium sp.]
MSQGGHLLLVDDEPQILRSLRPALTAAGYVVTTAETGAAALSYLAGEPCDIVILDLGLPDMDGKDVIVRIREWSETPIVVLSARDLELEKIAALDLGADDFVNKPFAVGELLARIRATLRGRDLRLAGRASFRSAELEVNFATRRAFVQGDEIRLTPREYDLVRTLARHPGRVVTHKQIIASVWGPEATVDAQFVRVLVAQLRQKLEENPSAPRVLLTEPGVGYRLASDEDA